MFKILWLYEFNQSNSTLLLKGKGLVKTVKNPNYLGDPINAVRILIRIWFLLDIEASKEKKGAKL
jgi:hypothetical protein